MVLLNELTEEVLLEILSYLSYDRRALCALAIASRRLSTITPHFIYGHVDLWVRWSDLSCSFSKQFELFHRSIKERPILAPLVQSVHLTWCKGWPGVKKIHETCARVNDLLATLSRIHSLGLTAFRSVNLHFEPTFRQVNPLKSLRRLRIKDRNSTFKDILEYMMIDGLESLTVEAMDLRVGSTDFDVADSGQKEFPSSISSFHIDGLGHQPEERLRRFLRLTTSLKTLSCQIPGVEQPGFTTYGRRMRSALSSAKIARTLEPVRLCLTSLELDDGTDTEWPNTMTLV